MGTLTSINIYSNRQLSKIMKKIRCKIDGSSYHVDIITKLLKNNNLLEIVENTNKVENIDVYYWISGFPIKKFINNPFILLKKKPIIVIHWIGTDVSKLNHNNSIKQLTLNVITILNEKRYKKYINLAVTPWLVNELKSAGINALYLPISSLNKEMNPGNNDYKDIDFVSYVPKNKFIFYGGPYILKLAKKLNNFKFAIIMSDVINNEKLPKNSIKNLILLPKLSNVELIKIYNRSKCFIRLTEHDGLSLSVLEALFYKLQIAWTYNFPYTHLVHLNDINGTEKTLSNIINNFSLNTEGHQYVLNNFSQNVIMNHYTKFFKMIRDNYL
jgi:hypothetical protein